MQLIKFVIGMLVLWSANVVASPSVDIINSCYQEKGEGGVEVVDLEPAFVDKPVVGCEDQLKASFEGRVYGAATCNDEQYLVVANQLFHPSQAINMSVDKFVVPGSYFSITLSSWSVLLKGAESYVCMTRTAFDIGKGRAYTAFYLMKHKPTPVKPEVYFYFLDKVDWSK